MTVREIIDQLKAAVFVEGDMSVEIKAGYSSDLLSDVMGNAPEESILFTIQAHKNTIAVASLAGIRAIVLCNGRSAPEDMCTAAEHEGISLIGTSKNQFTAGAIAAKSLGIV
jgi:hypothetical protein